MFYGTTSTDQINFQEEIEIKKISSAFSCINHQYLTFVIIN